MFIRFDQRTSIQEEAAARLGEIYREAGFQFVYFDGAEDVHEPYWFMVSWPQWLVYRQLKPAPLFAEGAAKAHFSWHILSRGNAFDHFAPEVIKAQTAKHPAREAERIVADFTRIDFGWLDFDVPDEKSIGMQPDMFEYVTSRAAAWDCPISLQPSLDLLEDTRGPPTTSRCSVGGRKFEPGTGLPTRKSKSCANWTRSISCSSTSARNSSSSLTGRSRVSPNKQVRAFSFRRAGKSYVIYWHVSGEGQLSLPLKPTDVRVLDEFGGQALSARQAGRQAGTDSWFLWENDAISSPIA